VAGTDSHARMLFRWAMALFAVTIVIGILNGMDLWDPPHNLLMTHVHAGTLGWITLAVVGASILMLGSRGGDTDAQSAGRVAIAAIAATVAYVLAFATTTSIVRPIMGTLMLVAIVWVLIWAWGRYSDSDRTTAQLGVLLALVSLAIGAVLGVLLGLFIARGSIPGLDMETASALAGAHPPAMLIGYLILAGAAIAHWLLNGEQTRPGRMVMWALFIAGLVVNIAFIADIEELIQLATLLEVAASSPSSCTCAPGSRHPRGAVATRTTTRGCPWCSSASGSRCWSTSCSCSCPASSTRRPGKGPSGCCWRSTTPCSSG
jgi:hypothetical protein